MEGEMRVLSELSGLLRAYIMPSAACQPPGICEEAVLTQRAFLLLFAQGLKTLVAMVADLPLQKTQLPVMNSSPAAFQQAAQQLAPMSTNAENPGLALSQVAINCIFQFLDCYNILPHSYLCRLLAQNGLVPRLYIVLKEVRSHAAHVHSTGAMLRTSAIGTQTMLPTSACPAMASLCVSGQCARDLLAVVRACCCRRLFN